ncbi:hypothetical protein NEF87_000806 [Candidatus Lokiarchaeum ossiferum]|uniref:Oxidoreductase n=1 Tax=Candidatus Lokiarchaeum ossiferum TaxID=2951803 RepID=A0ABY6HPQ5_9ARCH|nr:hypothetical protein NEF87_000806 [Candidatus Lokiarchaeum sp. B-35]
MISNLKDAICIVTGGTRGAGRGIALELGQQGATVVVTGRSLNHNFTEKNPETLNETAQLVEEVGGKCHPIMCDHTKEDDIIKVSRMIKEKFGKVDLLVNNVWGGYERYDNTFDDNFWKQPLWRWDKMFNSGVRAHFLTSKYIAPIMMEHKYGLIINTTFWDEGRFFTPLPYNVAKNAVNRLAYCMALELKKYNIAVLSLSPGWMRTEKIKREYLVDDYNYKEIEILKKTESTRYIGKAVVSLLTDPNIKEKTSKVLYVGNLAREYGFTDLDGSQPERCIASDVIE